MQYSSEVSGHRQVGVEVEFSVFGRRLTGKQWGSPTGAPTFALHGWLDNANTFDRLAPMLPELNIIALDFAGHGRSDHRPPGVHYHPLTDIQDVLAVAELLEWPTFNLLGHSMGAAISSELAATFPDRVQRAALIDGFVATGGVTLAERLEQNQTAVRNMLTAHTKQPRLYADTLTMAQRVSEATDQTEDAAAVLVERGHRVVDGGVTWRTDPRIRFPTPLRYSREHLNLLLQAARAPALLVVAEQGDEWYQGEVADAEAHYPDLTVVRMPGPHHIHLERAYVQKVAGHVRQFFGLPRAPQNPGDALEWDGVV
ncbi:MAG: alpha/beta fold hydrolase [Pseudomonadota bacterium]